MESLIEIKNLKTHFFSETGVLKAVDDISFSIDKGGTLAIVGESGCGKSVTALSIMRLIRTPPGKIVDGQVLLKGHDLLSMTEDEMRQRRGNEIAMIFQEPTTSLNPVFTCGYQISEAIRTHRNMAPSQANLLTIELLTQVGITMPERRVDEYPYELSGGMRQRVMIAIALSCNPLLLIADEPTTALDVTVQVQILELLRELQKQRQMAILLITHDLGVVAKMANRVLVMYTGRILEEGDVFSIFQEPRHPYTLGLFKSMPYLSKPRASLHTIPGMVPHLSRVPSGCSFNPRCLYSTNKCTTEVPPLFEINSGHKVRCWLYRSGSSLPSADLSLAHKTSDSPLSNMAPKPMKPISVLDLIKIEGLRKWFPIKVGFVGRKRVFLKAVDGVDLSIRPGETIGLVGESGCGKTTLSRVLLRLIEPTGGAIYFEGKNILGLSYAEMQRIRKEMQIIFQDPYGSLDPLRTAGEIIGQPLQIHGVTRGKEKEARVKELLELVGLSSQDMHRYPHEFSGGQRQRIGVARAVALNPKFIICDEPVSALDVSIQSQVLNLLVELQSRFGLTYLFISHNLGVVKHVSDRIAVMYLGKIVELAYRDDMLQNPLHPYSQALGSAMLLPDPASRQTKFVLEGDLPNPIDLPKGCRFHPRCRLRRRVCQDSEPILFDVGHGHLVACHL